MQINEVQNLWARHPKVEAVRQLISRKGIEHLLLSGLCASARAAVIRSIGLHPMLIVLDNADDALYMTADLKALGARAVCFPCGHRRRGQVDEAMQIQRTECLTSLQSPEATAESSSLFVVTYPEALAESVPAREELAGNSISLRKGETIDIGSLTEMLVQLGFERVDFVFQPGQFAIRGGIVDVYSYSHDDPYRLDFFGDEIDSIRVFDIENQLSKERVESADIVYSTGSTGATDGDSLVSYLPDDILLVSNDWSLVRFKLESQLNQEHATDLLTALPQHTTIEIAAKSTYLPSSTRIQFDTLPQPVFHKQFDLLETDLREQMAQGRTLYICSDQKKQTDRLRSIFESMAEESHADPIAFTPVQGALHEGFIDRDLGLAIYTDHQIFERYHRVTQQSENARRGKAIITLREINQLQPGDYVVHQDHGIGQFGGLVTTSVNGRPQEMIKINFRGGDFIFVSIHNLHRISKYKGKDGGEAPTISRLGSGAWERLKERTKDKVKDIARDLIRLYATRKQQAGHAYAPDSYIQQEMEASFLYEDTPDQAKATLDIKRDMESRQPMDRLVCGDVGFGKTEVAMRAAMKAATDGKQVAVLVPTTVLALQHYNTFRERMKNFPVRIEYLSRAKSNKQIAELLHDLKEGKIDILIGTHKLVGKSVVWHDLGLLIIDEEQKFGVAVKEKLKSLRTNIDVLTLTATPIPRTLQFSLLGARDLSVMTTPPQNRYPVQTELITMDDEDILREAIQLEMGRNGQIFVVNNRIDMLPRIVDRVRRLCPEARIAMAHGQMPMAEMEQVLEDFINYEYDVLVSTTIVESGIDIPNVNTIIIYSANHYGLSDLHQLRGRVGRSNRKAYCYLVAPEKELLTADARRRLEALEVFSELGSGFNLAMQDLDIRGAGNMLGSEQSGFIADLGYETYQKILNEAVEELRDEMNMEGGDDNGNDNNNDSGTYQGGRQWVSDCQLETDINICFPATYIENISERLSLYRELDRIHSEAELTEFKKRLIDRFGNLPDEAEELMQVVRLRWLCCSLGIEKIYLKQERMVIYFPLHNERYYRQSREFAAIIQYLLSRPERCHLVEEVDKKGEKTGKRYASITQVRTVAGAINLLSKLLS